MKRSWHAVRLDHPVNRLKSTSNKSENHMFKLKLVYERILGAVSVYKLDSNKQNIIYM